MRMEIFVDFEFTKKDFHFIQVFIRKNTGIDLAESKYSMVYARLMKRLRDLGIKTFKEYCAKFQEDEKEQVILINRITTNVTSFFRENHHFEFIVKNLLPEWREKKIEKIRIWSAGCSTGQEPYTIAMVLDHHSRGSLNFEIMATDLDSDVIAKSKKGVYPISSQSEIPQEYLKKYFKKGTGENEGFIKILSEIQNKVSFDKLNFQDNWNYQDAFDIIFCRNVMIYFNHETQGRLVLKFYDALKNNGYLFLGHSENIMRFKTKFKAEDKTIYQKAHHEESPPPR